MLSETSQSKPKTRKEGEIWHACKSLWEDGVNVEQMTGLAIGDRLEKLGFKRGSNTDIHRFKKSWMAEHKIDQFINNSDYELNSNLSSPIALAVNKVEKELTRQLQEQQSKIESDAKQKIATAQEQCERLNMELKDARQIIVNLEEQLSQFKFQINNLEISVHHEREQKLIYAARLNDLENHHQKLIKDTENRIKDLNDANQKNVEILKANIKDIINHHKDDISNYKNIFENEKLKYISNSDYLKQKIDDLEKINYENEQSNTKYLMENERILEANKFLQEENLQIKKQLLDVEKNTQAMQELIAHKSGEIKQLTVLINQKESYLCELQQKIIYADYHNTALQTKLDKAKEEINQIKSQHDMQVRKINANANSQNE
jgi:hypothetical protein